MKDRKYPYGWSGSYKTIEEMRSTAMFTKTHEEMLRRFFALCDFCFDHGLELGPGGGWRPLSQQLPIATTYHLRDDAPGFANACAVRKRSGGCCWYEGHFYIHRVDGNYLHSIHKAMPPSWHMGVPLPNEPATKMKDLDKYPCIAIDAIGGALKVRKDGGCFAGDHAAQFGLFWAGKADAPHFQLLEVRGKYNKHTNRPDYNSAGRTELHPFAGWPPQRIKLPDGYNDPFESATLEDDMAKFVRIEGDLAAFTVNGMEARWIPNPTTLSNVQRLGTVGKESIWKRSDLKSFILNGPEPSTSGASTITAADFAGHNPDK